MSYFEIMMIGIGLSMDAFAAAVCKGFSIGKADFRDAIVIGLFFGGFQALMPTIGYFLGKQFEEYIVSVDHWAAFALLSFIGGKMIIDVVKGSKEISSAVEKLNLGEIFLLAVATSIDALAVGISMAFLRVNIISAAATIGVTTFLLGSLGVMAGKKFGARYKDKATLAGGVILIGIGLKILLEHLEILG